MIADKVGKWGFLYDEAMQAHWEARLRAQGGLSEDVLAAELAAIAEEAALARVEISEAGELCSFVGEEPAYRATVRVEDGVVCFDKPGAVRVTLGVNAAGELTATEPGKPLMRFRRVRV